MEIPWTAFLALYYLTKMKSKSEVENSDIVVFMESAKLRSSPLGVVRLCRSSKLTAQTSLHSPYLTQSCFESAISQLESN
jgi:hypothetical protein